MRKAFIPAFLLLLGSMILGATVLREPIARAATPFTNVIVGNTASNPVPVSVQGTATVTAVDNHVPFQKAFVEGLNSGSFSATGSFTVPAGERLVIQYISVGAQVPPGQGLQVSWSIQEGSSTVVFGAVPLVAGDVEATSAGTFKEWAGAAPLIAYANPGAIVHVDMHRETSDGTETAPDPATLEGFVSGYLIPTP